MEPNTLANLIAESLKVVPATSHNDKEVAGVLAGIADRLDPAAAERVERVLHAALQRTTLLEAKWNLAIALTRVSNRLDGPSAMRVRREAARPMKDVFNEQSSLGKVKYVHQVNSMVDLAMQMEAVEGVALLTEALTVCPHFLIDVLVNGLSTVAATLDDVAGAHVCINAARILVERMRKSDTADLQYELPELLQCIPIVTERMERAKRLQVYEEAAGVLAEAEVRAAGSLNGDVGETLSCRIHSRRTRDSTARSRPRPLRTGARRADDF